MVSFALTPMILMNLKLMLLKSMFVGKMAIVLLAINALWRLDNSNRGELYSHNINLETKNHIMNDHYGYNGGEEYGAYVN